MLRTGSSGYSNFARGFNRMRLVAGAPFVRKELTSLEALIKQLDLRARAFEQVAFRTAQANRATTFVYPENALCGELVDDNPDNAPRWEYPASNTVPLTWRTPIASLLSQQATRISNARGEATTIILPTTYDATDPNGGKKLLANTAIVATGTGDTFLVDKTISTPVDGMGDSVLPPRDLNAPFVIVPFRDMFGDGKGVAVGIKLCVNLATPGPFSLLNEFRMPDVIVGCSYKAPSPTWWVDGVTVLLSDNAGPNLGEDFSGATGAWVPSSPDWKPNAPGAPPFERLARALQGTFAGKVLGIASQYSNVTPARLRRITYSRFGGVTLLRANVDGIDVRMYETPTVEVPATLDENRLNQTIGDVMSTKVSAFDTKGQSYAGDPVAEPFGPEQDASEPGIEPVETEKK